jgi:threonine dehydrogenase-like Zn-dependent dehydrogenase
MIEAIGGAQTLLAAVEAVAFTGRVVYIGNAPERVAYATRLVRLEGADILGSRNALPEDFAAVIRRLEQRRFPVKDVVPQMISVEEAPEVLRS